MKAGLSPAIPHLRPNIRHFWEIINHEISTIEWAIKYFWPISASRNKHHLFTKYAPTFLQAPPVFHLSIIQGVPEKGVF